MEEKKEFEVPEVLWRGCGEDVGGGVAVGIKRFYRAFFAPQFQHSANCPSTISWQL